MHPFPQAATQVSSVSLTEGALQRHNLAEVPRVPVRPTFSGKEISVNNRSGRTGDETPCACRGLGMRQRRGLGTGHVCG